VGWPADNAVGDVAEKPIENYPEDKQGSEAANLTSAYPIQKCCGSVSFHFPGSLHLRGMGGVTSP